MRKLEAPKGLTINFAPSPKQYIVWQALQGGVCDKCGGTLELRVTGHDKMGHPIHEPVCTKCGNEDIPELILAGGSAGGGKQMDLDSNICTPYGFKKVRDIRVGDTITDPNNGGNQRVIYLHPITTCNYYRIGFIDGTYSECSEEHLWQLHISSQNNKKIDVDGNVIRDRVWTTKMIYDHLHASIKPKNLIIPLTAPVQFVTGQYLNADKPIHPYMLGVLIGNGCMTNVMMNKGHVSYTTMDVETVERLKELGYDYYYEYKKKNNKAISYYYNQPELIEGLKRLKLSGHDAIGKFIPEQYKWFSIKERKELMQGLMDTDGYVDDRGHMSYTTISKQLAEDVAFVVRSLGGKATITSKIPTFTYKGEKRNGQLAYTVWIMTKMDKELVFLPRKKDRARNEFNGGLSELGKRIVSCEPIGKRTGRCITVDSPSGLYVADNFTVTHNSYLGCAWVVSSCLRYPGVRMVLARKELKSLIGTTWATMTGILEEWGLVQDIHYHVNNQRLVLTFWNGSSIKGMELSPRLNDPEWTFLGSLEISGIFIDEASEIMEKAVEVIQSRIRYKIAETFMVGKCLLSSNPAQVWLKRVFISDDDGNPVTLPKGLRYLPFSLFDNPNEQFRMVYFNRLRKIRDKTTRDRLLYGNWDYSAANVLAAYHSFDGDKHLVPDLTRQMFNPLKPLIISFDFNVSPQMSALPIQFDWDNKIVYIFKEFVGYPKDNLNNTPAFSRHIASKLREMNFVGSVLITGDPAGMARSTQTETGVNNFTIAMKEFQTRGIKTTLQIFNTQPAQISRLDFVNELLNGYDGWKIQIDMASRKLMDDLVYQMKNPDGTKEKKKVLMDNGTRAEKYGHMSDCFDYALVYYLNKEYNKFIHGEADTITTVGDSDSVYGQFEY